MEYRAGVDLGCKSDLERIWDGTWISETNGMLARIDLGTGNLERSLF